MTTRAGVARVVAQRIVKSLEGGRWSSLTPERRSELEGIADTIATIQMAQVRSHGLVERIRDAGLVWDQSKNDYKALRDVYEPLEPEERHFLDHAVAKRLIFGIKARKALDSIAPLVSEAEKAYEEFNRKV